MHLDHVAVAVKSIDRSIKRLESVLGYRQYTRKVTNSRQQVSVVFLSREGSPDLKLIEPAGEDSPLWSSLRSRGEGLHHLGFRVDDTKTSLDEMSERGLRALTVPEPGEAFGDHLIAFGFVGSGLNIELIDTDERRGLPGDADG